MQLQKELAQVSKLTISRREFFMANITFIEPGCSFNAYGYYRLPLMGPLCLGTILKQAGNEVTVLRDNVRSVYDKSKELLHETIMRADVVAISVMTSSANRAYQLADAIKKIVPRIKIIMGGPHATYMSDEAIQHADLVFKGEGEGVILEAVNNKNLTGIIQAPHIEDLNSIPFPDFSLLSDQDKPPRVTPLSTSRGCPYDCVFCTVSSTFGRKYRFRDPENILEEMEMRVAQGHRKFFFYDDNFAANRENTKKLLEGILRKGLKIEVSAEARTNIAKDEELLKLMAKANCNYILIGFESINPDALKAYEKRQTVEDVKNCIIRLQENNLKVHGMFILGSDEDDSNTAGDTVKFCREMKLDSIQLAILHPLPGSRLYNILDSEGRIFTKDWSLYDGTHVVFKPKKLSPLELQEKFFWVYKKFYSLTNNPVYFAACRYIVNKWHKVNKERLIELKKRFNPKS